MRKGTLGAIVRAAAQWLIPCRTPLGISTHSSPCSLIGQCHSDLGPLCSILPL